MKALELINKLREGAFVPERTCDTVKAGDPCREIHRVAICMFATVEIIRAAREWGADMLIVHEPTYYNHWDEFLGSPAETAKRKLIEESGMVIYRYHDSMHFRENDMITEGELHYLGLTGKRELAPPPDSYLFTSDIPITALDLAKKMEKLLGIRHVRIAGNRDTASTRIATCFGTPGGVFDLLKRNDVEIVLTGEACEWQLAEYARDAAALGINKSLIVMGHIGSERDGMRLLTEKIKKNYTEFETKYFECGEVYTYTDT